MKRRTVAFSFLPLLAIALVAIVFLRPFSVGAAPGNSATHKINSTDTKQRSHHAHSQSNVIYHGGPVMAGTMNAYAIFWEPTGSFVSSRYNKLIKRYFHDIGGSPLYHNDSQYTDSNGNSPSNAVLAGSWVDTSAYPSSPLSDTDIQNEVTHAQTVNGWQSGIDNAFFVFTAKGEDICTGSSDCFSNTFCGYHSYFGTDTIYAVLPYTNTFPAFCGVSHSPNHDVDADSTINILSHEQNESATDPLITAWLDPLGNEIADKCLFIFGSTNAAGGDVTWNGHSYEVQKEWDNKKSKCVLSGP